MKYLALVVCGEVLITGCKWTLFGAPIVILLLGCLMFGMGLINLSAKVMVIITGVLLIVTVLLPAFLDSVKAWRKLRLQKQGSTTENV